MDLILNFPGNESCRGFLLVSWIVEKAAVCGLKVCYRTQFFHLPVESQIPQQHFLFDYLRTDQIYQCVSSIKKLYIRLSHFQLCKVGINR